MPDTTFAPVSVEHFSEAERDRLVRLCAHLSGSSGAAEDLAQETLLEAWRSRDRLRDPSAPSQWLSGIARNVCMRWRRRQATAPRLSAPTLTFGDVEIQIADDIALDIALERSEVADLLEHALTRLPAGVRDLLVERYVEDLPAAEMAARRGISAGTAAVRLHRGTHALRRIMRTDLREEAAALGLFDQPTEEWQATRIWCPFCGEAHLQALREIETGSFAVRCTACRHRMVERAAARLGQITGYWRTLLRVNREANRYFRAAMACGCAACACCGRSSRLQYFIPRAITELDRDAPGVCIRCDSCGAVSMQPDLGLALTHPVVERFWRKHKRMRFAGRQEIVYAGRDAALIRFEGVTDTAAVEVVAAADNFEVLYVGGDREVHP